MTAPSNFRRHLRPRAGADDGPSPRRVVTSVVASLCAAAVPVFLLGALQLRIADDLGMSSTAVGLGIAVFFLSGAAGSIPGGRLVDRIGAVAAMRLGMAGTVLATLGIARFARAPWQLMVGMAVGGAVLALIDPSGARSVARRVPTRRQGLAFGCKEASIPLASLLAGLTLPVLGAQIGWRPAFVGAAALATLTGLSIPRGIDRADAAPGIVRVDDVRVVDEPGIDRADAEQGTIGASPMVLPSAGAAAAASPLADQSVDEYRADAEHHDESDEDGQSSDGIEDAESTADAASQGEQAHMRGEVPVGRLEQPNDTARAADAAAGTVQAKPPTLLWLALAAGAAGGVSASVATFLVPTASRLGVATSAAGFLLAVASILSITSRVWTGVLVDRRPGSELTVLAILMGTGSLGVGGLAALSFRGDSVGALGFALLAASAMIALGAGWGWPGLIFLAAIRVQPASPARAAGAVLAGLATGGAGGPLLTGALADTHGFATTWIIGAGAMLLAATLVAGLSRRRNQAVPT